MKTTVALTVAGLFLFATCGSDDSDRLRSDPDVQAVLEGYEELGATEAELNEMIVMIDDALDVYDTAEERRDYLRDLRDMAELDVEP